MPLGADELVKIDALLGAGGREALVEFGGEGGESFGVLAGEDGCGGFAGGGFGSGGFPGVAAIGFNLA